MNFLLIIIDFDFFQKFFNRYFFSIHDRMKKKIENKCDKNNNINIEIKKAKINDVSLFLYFSRYSFSKLQK